MKINLCVYSDQKFEPARKALVHLAERSECFEQIFEYDRNWLESTPFYSANNEILDDRAKGDGWCLWKPYVIMESLEKTNSDDVVLYMDSTDTFVPTIKKFLENYFTNKDVLVSQMGENPNYKYCKRDAFVKMGCDSHKFWTSVQLEAGITAVKNNQVGRDFIGEYLQWCQDPIVIKDSPNSLGLANFPGYVRHMYDQAVLTILKEKHGLVPSRDIRYFVECNMWECLKFWENGQHEFNRKVHRVCNDLLGNKKLECQFWQENYLLKLNPDA